MRCLPTILRPLAHACLLRWQRCRLLACPPSGSVIRCCRLCRKASRGHSGRDPFLQEPSCARPLGHRALVPHGPLPPPEAVGAVGQKHSPQARPVGRTPPEPWSTPARWGNGGRVCPRRGTRRGRSPCSIVAERRLARCVKPLVRAELIPSRLTTWWCPQHEVVMPSWHNARGTGHGEVHEPRLWEHGCIVSTDVL